MPTTPPVVGTVFLVGAGPGDPGLLTLRAAECLQQAAFILVDANVNPRVLDLSPAEARREAASSNDAADGERLVVAARRGENAVYLCSGDPFFLGEGGKLAERLVAAGVPYEVIPGVPAVTAAAACAGIPLPKADIRHDPSTASRDIVVPVDGERLRDAA